MNKGQGLVEYAMLIAATGMIVAIIIMVIMVLNAPLPPICDRSRPTAGDVVDCIATRTAEAKSR